MMIRHLLTICLLTILTNGHFRNIMESDKADKMYRGTDEIDLPTSDLAPGTDLSAEVTASVGVTGQIVIEHLPEPKETLKGAPSLPHPETAYPSLVIQGISAAASPEEHKLTSQSSQGSLQRSHPSFISQTTGAITQCLDSPDASQDQKPPTLPAWAVPKLESRVARSRATGKFLANEPMCSQGKLARAAALTTAALEKSGGLPKLPLPSVERGPVLLLTVETNEKISNLAANTFCGVHRVGLAAQTLVLAMDRAAEQLAKSFGLQAVHDEHFLSVLDQVSEVSTLRYRRVMSRILGSLAILEQGRDVLYADIDTFWLQNPFPYLEGLGVDFVASRDTCWADINGGFLFFRSVETTKRLLLTALGNVFRAVLMIGGRVVGCWYRVRGVGISDFAYT